MAKNTEPSPPAVTRYVILAAIDDSASAEAVVHEAAAMAARTPGAELHLAHVVDSLGVAGVMIGGSPLALPGAAELLRRAREYLMRHSETARLRSSRPVIGHICIGMPWREIVQLATNLDVDLIVIGTHDAKGLERLFLGSRTEIIARAAPCPVLIVRPKTVHRTDVPEIVPACPACVAAQRSSAGGRLWCERHAQHHAHAHVWNETPESFGVGWQTYRDALPPPWRH